MACSKLICSSIKLVGHCAGVIQALYHWWMSILRKRASCASLECMGNTLNVMQDACCDRMDVFDRARMEKALAGPSYTIPDHVRTAQAIVDFISSKATPPKYEPLVHANLWNGEENV